MILEGKVAIVAGAGPGIGAGVAHVLAEEGADLAALDINQGNADKVAEDAKKLGRRAIGIGTDLTSKAECEKAVKTTPGHLRQAGYLGEYRWWSGQGVPNQTNPGLCRYY